MPLTNELLNVDGLDLLTDEEKKFNALYVKKLLGYSEGKVEGTQIRNLTAGAATIAKRQQSRSGVALLKWNVQMYETRNPEAARPALSNAARG